MRLQAAMTVHVSRAAHRTHTFQDSGSVIAILAAPQAVPLHAVKYAITDSLRRQYSYDSSANVECMRTVGLTPTLGRLVPLRPQMRLKHLKLRKYHS